MIIENEFLIALASIYNFENNYLNKMILSSQNWWHKLNNFDLIVFSLVGFTCLGAVLYIYKLRKYLKRLEEVIDKSLLGKKLKENVQKNMVDNKILQFECQVSGANNTIDDDNKSEIVNRKRNITKSSTYASPYIYDLSEKKIVPQCVSIIANRHLSLIKAIGKSSHVKFKSHIENNLWILALPHAVDYLLLNLIPNIIKHANYGETILFRLEQSGKFIEITVSSMSNFIIISEFEKLLTKLKKVIEYHSGSIAINNMEGNSEFCVMFPKYDNEVSQKLMYVNRNSFNKVVNATIGRKHEYR